MLNDYALDATAAVRYANVLVLGLTGAIAPIHLDADADHETADLDGDGSLSSKFAVTNMVGLKEEDVNG